MKIGIAGPIDISLLRDLFSPGAELPNVYQFALTAHLARALHNRGHEVVLFVLSREVTNTRRIEGARLSAYICRQRRPLRQMLDFFRGERHGLRDAMRASNCDVIHAHWTYEFGSAAVESGLPHVVTAHDIFSGVLRFARHPYWLEKPLLAWPVLRNAKCVTAVSPYVAQALRPFVAPGIKITVIPNGATRDVFARYEERQARRQAGPFTFASVLNGFSARKNGARLIEAFSILRKEFGERIELQMFGVDHEPGGPAQQWSRQRRLEDGVRFVGSQPYESLMAQLAQETDVLVHPSREEAHCMAVTEAMAMGIPVIAGATSGGIPWALADGKAGLLVDVESPSAISSGMRSLMEDQGSRDNRAESAHEKALSEFDLEMIAGQYESVLMNAIQEQAS